MKIKILLIFYVLSLLLIISCGSAGDSEDDAALLPPASVQAGQVSGQVDIYFGKSAGAASYNIYWSNNPGVDKTDNKITNVTTTPYHHTPLTNGNYYYYAMSAVNGTEESELSEEVNAVPSVLSGSLDSPADIASVPVSGKHWIKVSWKAVSGASSYNVYWSTSAGVTTASTSKLTGQLSPATIGSLVSGTTYYIIVTAKNPGNESSASIEVSAVSE